MDENIVIYDVKAGDTLDRIGAEIGMTGDQLKDFHNANCEKLERLWFNNLNGVRQIIIPKEYKTPEQLRRERITELPPSSVTRDFYAQSYQISENFSRLAEDKLEINYTVEVAFKKREEISIPEEVADVKCFGFKKNGTPPDDKMSAIAIATMESTYPISLVVPFQGKVSAIYEHNILKKRFDEKRPEMEEFFTGEIYKAYLDKFSESISNEESLIRQFSSSLLYQLLFPRMEWFHKSNPWVEEFYFIQNSFPLKCAMNANYDHQNDEFVATVLQGNIKDAYSLQEILRGKSFDDEAEEFADGAIELRYITDKKTKKMLRAEASVTFRNDNELYQTQTVKLTPNGIS